MQRLRRQITWNVKVYFLGKIRQKNIIYLSSDKGEGTIYMKMSNKRYSIFKATRIDSMIPKGMQIQSNFNGSNIFGTIENCSRHGWFEPMRVNYGAKSGRKWR